MPSSDYSPSPVLKRKHKAAVIDSPDPSPLRENTRRTNVPPAGTGAVTGAGEKERMERNDDRAEKAARRKSALGASTSGTGSTHGHGQLGEDRPRRPGGHGQSGVGQGESSAAGAQAQAQQGKRVVSALQMQQQKKGKQLNAVDAPAKLLMNEEAQKTYESWIKLATDNKITAANTWNFALIDYFADLTVLRNDEDQSINFQKASVTLEGCVKVWTSRVDSVATETGKLLNGLAGGRGELDDDEDREGGEGEEGEDGAEGQATEGKKRKTHRSETLAKSFDALKTKKFDLEFTVDPLFKKTCADFDEGGAMGLLMNHLSVDGKGRVVFDAGDVGVQGANGEEEDEAMEEDELVDLGKLRDFLPSAEEMDSLQISDTLSAFRFSSDPSAVAAQDFAAIFGLKDTYDDPPAGPSSPSHFNAGEDGGTEDFFGGETFEPTGPMGHGGWDDGASIAGDGDGDGDEGDGDNPFSSNRGGLAMARPGEHHAPFDPRSRGPGNVVVAYLGSGGGAEGEDGDGGAGEGRGMLDYFDQRMGGGGAGAGKAGGGWAGAEHWKLRRVPRRDQLPGNAQASGSSPKKRTAKAPFTIDFATPAPASLSQTTKVLFAPGSKAALSLPSASASGTKSKRGSKRGSREGTGGTANTSGTSGLGGRRREEWLLPDDMHFSSRQLLRLFLKPKFSLRIRRNAPTARMAQNLQSMGADGEVDERFWAQAAIDRVGAGEDVDMETPGLPVPFESQFFNDADADDGDYGPYGEEDVGLPGSGIREGTGIGLDGEEAENLLAGTNGTELRTTKRENVHFAKKAKRVDVKRLKDDIWDGLKGLVAEKVGEGENAEDTADEDMLLTSSRPVMPRPSSSQTTLQKQVVTLPTGETQPAQQFSSIISSLRQSYPREKMNEISTSFCFICLLHLANEEGLGIESARMDGKDGEDVGCVGMVNLEDLEDEDEGEGGAGEEGAMSVDEDEGGKGKQTKNKRGVGGASGGKRRLDEGERRDRVVGELQALRVWKDPTAGRAA